jgi:hypothetical protein
MFFSYRLNHDGNFLDDKIVMNRKEKAFIYPNPGDEMNVQLAEWFPGTELYLYDLYGKIIHKENIIGNKQRILTKQLRPGIYFWQISIPGHNTASGKWVRL